MPNADIKKQQLNMIGSTLLPLFPAIFMAWKRHRNVQEGYLYFYAFKWLHNSDFQLISLDIHIDSLLIESLKI